MIVYAVTVLNDVYSEPEIVGLYSSEKHAMEVRDELQSHHDPYYTDYNVRSIPVFDVPTASLE